MRSCTVMIVNWNGAARLEAFLPSVVEAAGRVGADVWVVDNASADDSERVCRERFPSVHFHRSPENRSLAAFNEAAERCTSDIVVHLDNDIAVDAEFLGPLLEHFDDDDVFGVTAGIRPFPVGGAAVDVEAATGVVFVKGMLRRSGFRPLDRPSHVFFNLGGATARDRARFLELGGFDDLFFPLYHEDVDLSWRAWKRGWRCVYEPRSTIWHEGGGALGRNVSVSTLMVRNEYLFHWKNLTTPRLLAVHVIALAPRFAAAALRRDRARLLGFWHALPLLGTAISRRHSARAQARRGDDDAIRAVNAPWAAGSSPPR